MGNKRRLIIIAALLIASWLTYEDYTNFQLALKSMDPEICPRLRFSQFSDACYSGVGIARMDITLCDKPQSPDERLRCAAVVQANATICLGVKTEETKDFCYFYVALRTADRQLCMLVRNLQRRSECEGKIPTPQPPPLIQKPPKNIKDID